MHEMCSEIGVEAKPRPLQPPGDTAGQRVDTASPRYKPHTARDARTSLGAGVSLHASASVGIKLRPRPRARARARAT